MTALSAVALLLAVVGMAPVSGEEHPQIRLDAAGNLHIETTAKVLYKNEDLAAKIKQMEVDLARYMSVPFPLS